MPIIRFLPLLLTFAIVACATTASVGSPRLHILLTNDDGYDAIGIQTLKEALRSAGHRVTVVAPAFENAPLPHSLQLVAPAAE